jgi:hypothetical protein
VAEGCVRATRRGLEEWLSLREKGLITLQLRCACSRSEYEVDPGFSPNIMCMRINEQLPASKGEGFGPMRWGFVLGSAWTIVRSTYLGIMKTVRG